MGKQICEVSATSQPWKKKTFKVNKSKTKTRNIDLRIVHFWGLMLGFWFKIRVSVRLRISAGVGFVSELIKNRKKFLENILFFDFY